MFHNVEKWGEHNIRYQLSHTVYQIKEYIPFQFLDQKRLSKQGSITLYKAVVTGEKQLTPTQRCWLSIVKRPSVTVIAPIYTSCPPLSHPSPLYFGCKSLRSSQWGWLLPVHPHTHAAHMPQTAYCSFLIPRETDIHFCYNSNEHIFK